MERSESELVSLAERLGSTQLGAVLAEWSIGDLIEAGKAVEGLTDHPGWQVLSRVLEESREFALVSLIHAPRTTENAAAVQRQLGIVKGLETFRTAIPTISEKAKLAQEKRDKAAEKADEERQAQTT